MAQHNPETTPARPRTPLSLPKTRRRRVASAPGAPPVPPFSRSLPHRSHASCRSLGRRRLLRRRQRHRGPRGAGRSKLQPPRERRVSLRAARISQQVTRSGRCGPRRAKRKRRTTCESLKWPVVCTSGALRAPPVLRTVCGNGRSSTKPHPLAQVATTLRPCARCAASVCASWISVWCVCTHVRTMSYAATPGSSDHGHSH